MVSVIDSDFVRSLLVDGEHVLNGRIVVSTPIGNQDGVSAGGVNLVRQPEGRLEHVVTKHAKVSIQSIHSWESAGALPQVEVQVLDCIVAVLLEPWVLYLKGEVSYLVAGNCESDRHLLYGLRNLVRIFDVEVLVNGNRSCIKVGRGNEIRERHNKDAVIALCVTNLGHASFCPVISVSIVPRSSVSFASPRVSYLCQFVTIDSEGVQQSVDMSTNETVWCRVGIAATNSHWMILLMHVMEEVKQCVHVIVFFRQLLVVHIENWFVRQLSQDLTTGASLCPVIVSVELGKCFLKQRHPPSTMCGSARAVWNEVIGRIRVLVPSWKAVVDVDGDPFVVGPEVVSEDTLPIV